MRFMFAKFKEDIIEDLSINFKDKDYDDGYGFIAVSFMAKYNRLDLLEIVFSDTDLFNVVLSVCCSLGL